MIHAIFAVDDNGGLGFQGQLPWPHITEDMKFFRDTTTSGTFGKKGIVVMGRKTWESLPTKYKPLPGRINVVVSRGFILPPKKSQWVYSISPNFFKIDLDRVVDTYFYESEIFITGGKQVLELALPYIEHMYITRVHGTFPADVVIDMDSFLADFHPIRIRRSEICTFEEYNRNETVPKQSPANTG